jgi:hypothetical protein
MFGDVSRETSQAQAPYHALPHGCESLFIPLRLLFLAANITLVCGKILVVQACACD